MRPQCSLVYFFKLYSTFHHTPFGRHRNIATLFYPTTHNTIHSHLLVTACCTAFTAAPFHRESGTKRFSSTGYNAVSFGFSPYISKVTEMSSIGSRTWLIFNTCSLRILFFWDVTQRHWISNYRRLEDVPPERRESSPTTMSHPKRSNPQQNRYANLQSPNLFNTTLCFVSYANRQEVFQRQLIDKIKFSQQHGYHNKLTYHIHSFDGDMQSNDAASSIRICELDEMSIFENMQFSCDYTTISLTMRYTCEFVLWQNNNNLTTQVTPQQKHYLPTISTR
jgi:hypothetical protein